MPDTARDDSDLSTATDNPGNPGVAKQVDVDSARWWAQSPYAWGNKELKSNMQKDSDAASSPNHRLSVTKTPIASAVGKLHPAAVAAKQGAK